MAKRPYKIIIPFCFLGRFDENGYEFNSKICRPVSPNTIDEGRS